MKGSRWFALFILLFFGLLLLEYQLPKRFVWRPTFGHYDHQPFGCAVFDSLLSVSLPAGYSVSAENFIRMEQQDTTRRKAVLVLGNYLSWDRLDVEAMLRMVARGDRVLIAANSYYDSMLRDTLGVWNYGGYFNPSVLKRQASLFLQRDTIYWVGDSLRYPRREFYAYPHLCFSSLELDSLCGKVLAQTELLYVADDAVEATQEETDTIAVPVDYAIESKHYEVKAAVVSFGKGSIVFSSTPLLFTNYGVLDGENASYVFRLLSQLEGLPVVRTTAYTSEAKAQTESPFRFLLAHVSLRRALYLTMLGICLFMFCTARRRQRAIPVVRTPDNKSLEFISLIGSLYFRKKDYAHLIGKKFVYFSETLRREVQVDIEDVAEDRRSFRRLAQKTGMDAEEIETFIKELRPVLYGGRAISADEMKRYIDTMNKIIGNI